MTQQLTAQRNKGGLHGRLWIH